LILPIITLFGLGWTTFAGTFVTSIAPAANLIEGDLWYKVDDGSFNVFYIDEDNTAQWVETLKGQVQVVEVQLLLVLTLLCRSNDDNSIGGSAHFTYSKNTPTLSLKGLPVACIYWLRIEILGPAKTLIASTGYVLRMKFIKWIC